MKKHLGFTLAEVLITLGIIGVVAAMTIPTLRSNTNSSEMKTAFKKVLSAMNQAVTMSVALNYVDFADITQTNTADDSLYQILNDKMHIVRFLPGGNNNDEEARMMGFADSNYTLFFADGMTLSYNPTNMHHCTNFNVAARSGRCTAIVDVNGKRKPNKLSNCQASMNQGSNNGYVSADNVASGATVDNKGVSHDAGVCHDGNAQIIDQFSVLFKGQQVLPNGYAARYVLYNN